MHKNEGLEVKAVVELRENGELYKLVDFLNKNLKDKEVVFGLTQNKERMKITMYKTGN